ncbi:hypothetical protein [Rothia nasimurium]|uniref:hypothetical protein n=1 Tax=Rothia nasimurium TaxID=85336 RepID=UPI0016249BDC|nr:hypothetical protein [Rothia nasimurium]
MNRQDLQGTYRQKKRPGIVAGAALGLSLLLAVVASFFLAGTSTLGRSPSSEPIEHITVTRKAAVPGYSDAQCWQAFTRVAETNILGKELLSHKFSVIWCAKDGGIVYQQDATTVDYEGPNMRSDPPANPDYSLAYELDSLESYRTVISRMVNNSSGLPSYGFERCVAFTLDAEGTAEGELSCVPN